MAASKFETAQYMADKFVESAGAVIFRLSTKQVCLLHYLPSNEYLLTKGRRNCSESRQAAALREILEESGYQCTLLPVNMQARCPPAVEDEQPSDIVRSHTKVCEPFAVQIRQLSPTSDDVKLIWWYVAAIDERKDPLQHTQDAEQFAVELFDYDDAINHLTFRLDREIVQKAIDLVSTTYG